MRSPPEDFDAAALTQALADGWALDVADAEYAAVGGGSYHWVVTDARGARSFATVDDLDQKPWLGETREAAYAGLERAFATAVALRRSGLAFVVAPVVSSAGGTLCRIDTRYSLSLFPFVDGDAGTFGRYEATERTAIVAMLSELHRATPAVAAVALTIGLDLPGRVSLDAALRDTGSAWSAGPFSEPARQVLARHASDVAQKLSRYDRLSAAVATSRDRWVITHGEPHAANVMRTAHGHVLIDWDTVALAPPERDLWMLVRGGEEALAAYTAATGHRVDHAAVDFFRLRWNLADIAAFTDVLRSPHQRTNDTVAALENLTITLASQAAGSTGTL